MQRLQTQVIVFRFLLKYIQNTNDKANSKRSQTKNEMWMVNLKRDLEVKLFIKLWF